jgi:acetylxylan esterase
VTNTCEVVAVVQMGDPSHVPGLPQDVGTSQNAGVFPRVNTAACGASADVTQSFCDDNDTFCDSGNSLAVHIGYIQTAGTQASDFIIGKVNGNATTT